MARISKNAEITPRNVISCDDIRRELTGKDILIGVYGGDIFVPSIPATIEIALWVEVLISGNGSAKWKLRVVDPAGSKAGETSVEQVFEIDPKFADHEITSGIPLPPLPISVIQEGLIRVYWESGEAKPRLIGQKAVIVGVPTPAPGTPGSHPLSCTRG